MRPALRKIEAKEYKMTDTKNHIDENMTERIINAILFNKFDRLFKKYFVKLSYADGKKEVHVLTEEQVNQFNQLMQRMSNTPNTYVVAVANESNCYRFAKLYYANQEKDK